MFFDVFPTLEVNGDMKKLLSETEVTKVGMNHEKDHIRIYLNGTRLIHKKNIYQLEKNIHDQIFKNRHMDVKVIEKYQLSEQYTAEKLMDLYKDSILEELKNYSLMEYNLLRSAKMEFTGDSHLLLTLENTIIAQTRSHEIVEFLEKVVCERCGLDLSVELAFEEPKESKHKKNSDLQIQFEIKNILKRVQLHEESAPAKAEEVQPGNDVQTADTSTKTATKEQNHSKESAAGNNAGNANGKGENSFGKKEFRKKYDGGSYGGYKKSDNPDVLYGKDFEDETIPIEKIVGEMGEVTIRCQVMTLETREIRNEKTIVIMSVTDFTDSIVLKIFTRNDQLPELLEGVKKGAFLKIKGVTTIDKFDSELTIGSIVGIKKIPDFTSVRMDTSPEKRVELHCHTKMSDMDFDDVEKLNVGAAIIVTGKLVATPGTKQPFEIQAEQIEIEGVSTPDYPLQKKKHSFEYLRTISHLRPRTNTFEAVFRVRSLIAYAIHKFFQERDFVYVHTPLITGSDCEGAGEMFQVTTLDMNNLPKNPDGTVDYTKDFFNKPTNLTVSGQLNGETYAMAFKNIYTFGPTFRAENSNTTRHAAEFWMIEPEIAFADLEDDMILAESMLKYIINYVLENAPEEMAFFNNFIDKGLLERLQHVANSDFARVTYTEAVEILEKHNDKFEYKVSWGTDLQTEHERYLTEEIFKRPVFVTDYPKEIKAFYMKMNDDGKTVAAVDCLVPGIGEIIGGSQREDDYDKLLARINELGLKEEDYQFYLDLRKYGSARHAGFGLGFERCVMYLTGMSNIRDVIPFPRTVNNCEL